MAKKDLYGPTTAVSAIKLYLWQKLNGEMLTRDAPILNFLPIPMSDN